MTLFKSLAAASDLTSAVQPAHIVIDIHGPETQITDVPDDQIIEVP
jgi:hypothetical protein